MSPFDYDPAHPPISQRFERRPAPAPRADAPAHPWARRSWEDEVTVAAEEWLVDRLVPARAYTGLFGRRGSAKSFLALDLAFKGALGLDFLGRRTSRFGSVYCVGEKESRFGKRVAAWRQARGLIGALPAPLEFRWGAPNLLDAAEVAEFTASLIAARPAFEARGAPLGAVFLDTLARCLGGGSASDPETANRALDAIHYIVAEAAVAVIPAAHVAKAAGSDSLKGPGEWEDQADALIRIERKEGGATRVVTNTKQSDERDGDTWAFELELVTVGANARGEPVTSCVVREVDAPEVKKADKVAKLSAAAETVRVALVRLMEAGVSGLVPPLPNTPPNQRGTMLRDVRQASYEMGLCRASEPPEDWGAKRMEQWKEARKKTFQRAMDKLQEAGLIRLEGDWVWPLT